MATNCGITAYSKPHIFIYGNCTAIVAFLPRVK